MRHSVHYAHSPRFVVLPPTPSPSPSPSLTGGATDANSHTMLASFFLALFLPCAAMTAGFIIYIFLLWYASSRHHQRNYRRRDKPVEVQGLSTSELEKLPTVTGKELGMGMGTGTECAVCLEEIASEQPARVVPGCHHGFHMQCVDTWLSRNSVCPVCRMKLDAEFFSALETPR